jgi:hypothetical protein
MWIALHVCSNESLQFHHKRRGLDEAELRIGAREMKLRNLCLSHRNPVDGICSLSQELLGRKGSTCSLQHGLGFVATLSEAIRNSPGQ